MKDESKKRSLHVDLSQSQQSLVNPLHDAPKGDGNIYPIRIPESLAFGCFLLRLRDACKPVLSTS